MCHELIKKQPQGAGLLHLQCPSCDLIRDFSLASYNLLLLYLFKQIFRQRLEYRRINAISITVVMCFAVDEVDTQQ